MRNIFLIACVFLLFSCEGKNEKNKISEKKTSINKIEKDNIFSVDLNVKILEDDRLQLFFIEDDPESGFSADKRMYIDIKGKDEFQVVSFKLPSGVLPYRFRVDLGENKIESDIQIKSIVIKFNQGVMDIDSATFPRLFSSNIYLNTTDYKTFSRKIIDTQYDPYIVSTPLLDKKIEIDL
ncbi:conserved hypothetical protein [Formosa agariphila KMM 3901]|uniref:Lipoprotein n=1 Tax=Formosa agariphila (strain DSM 15362 / KCTC 12365 / LMG 23005 / KMM 3901 / M-2Alg 35-1) TaxID=1347342 RepID=T2KR60_FORAG|nr:hypothetical protein [Formosa agariphila]CDF81220.1 conserved hypothetical protein [Formosa agariphila KMM 3901]